jgi:hypothetical protein
MHTHASANTSNAAAAADMTRTTPHTWRMCCAASMPARLGAAERLLMHVDADAPRIVTAMLHGARDW